MDVENDVNSPSSSKNCDYDNTILKLLQIIRSTLLHMKTELTAVGRRVKKLELENSFKKHDPWKDMAETDRSQT